MTNSQHHNQLPGQNPGAGSPQQGPRRFTPGEITFHILIVALLMASSAIAFKMSSIPGIQATIIGSLATSISVFLVAYMSNTLLHTLIHNAVSEWVSNKFDDLYTVLGNMPQETRYSALILVIYICFLSLIIFPFIFLASTHPSVLSRCDTSLNLLVKQNAETTGLSTGCIVFDTQRADGTAKIRAAAMLMQGQIEDGITTLDNNHAKDPSDGELIIDAANQQVLLVAHNQHTTIINIIVATILTGKYVYMGRDELQGVATAQHEFNQENKAAQLVVTIANLGSNQDNTTTMAKQIANAATYSSSIHTIGIIGPPLCSQTKTLIDMLKAKNVELPVISPEASCDNLTNYSPELYQIAPSNLIQAQIAAWYIQYVLHAQHVVIFTNRADTEGTFNQANDFMKLFPLQTIVETYEPGDTKKIIRGLQDAVQSKPLPDAILFTGVSDDLNTLLTNLPTTGSFAHIPVIGLDPLYSLGGYDKTNQQMRANFQRLRLVALFFPDEAIFLKEKQPAFMVDYPRLFDPNNTHASGIYGFSRMDSTVALAYDATNVLLNALPAPGTAITTENIIDELINTADGGAWQGVTGQIDFLHGTVPYNKAIVILTVDSNDKFHMVMLASGCYEKGQCAKTIQGTPEITVGAGSPPHRYIFSRYGKDNMLIVRQCF
ncbi:MAG TPA: ABC transporter substrate-binding protein [Ktedonobacteraceae bacterium]|nr:ABC transporter substrate-binding protein [Ktedonobacteraceae bacterium]